MDGLSYCKTLTTGIGRADFPQLNSDELVYFDNASTALKPNSVIQTVAQIYRQISNVGRSRHKHAEYVTAEFERSRDRISEFIGCSPLELLFTHNCTDSVNLISSGLGLGKGDRVIVSELEHHSNLLPWLEKADLHIVRLDSEGLLDLNHLEELLRTPARLVAVCHASNITGNVQPVAEICKLARMYGALTLVDCAQTVGHIPVDTRSIGCDFLVFSPHKVFAPSGVGGLYIRHEAQPLVRNFRFGGGMVDQVGNEHVRYKSGLARFEAGTPNIEGVIGTGAAIDFVDSIGLSTIQLQNKGLDAYLRDELSKCKFIELPFLFSKIRVPIVTFNVAGAIDLQTLSVLLSDVHGIAVNVGFQCNQPLYQSLGLKGGLRASLHMYNNKSEIDCFVSALNELLS